MAGKRIEIMDLRQLITLKEKGLSNRKTADMLQVSRNTVNEYVKLFKDHALSFEQLMDLNDFELQQLLPTKSEVSQGRYEDLACHFDYFSKELAKPGCTLLQLWRWYRQRHPEGYAYTQFTHHYRLWARPQKASGKLTHIAGEKVFVDYTGKKLHIVDNATGDIIEVEVFVGILPCSQYVFVEASRSQRREDFIGSMRRCLEYFGGGPKAIISDNLKSAVTKSCKYEPTINKTFKDFALHYGCVIDPARPHSPQDKALVEGAVSLVYQRIFYPLDKMTFFSIEELNRAIKEKLIEYNAYKFQHTNYSRRELFVSSEQNHLQPLPSTPYQIRHYKRAKVQKMGYVFFSQDKHYYSVPYRYIGHRVELRYTERCVEIFYNHQRLCTHKRNYSPGKYSTISGHPPSSHQAHNEWDLDFFQRKARGIGPYAVKYITNIILQYSYPEIGYKQAMGIIHLTRLYSKARIEKACQRGLSASKYNYKIIDNILKNGQDQLELPFESEHNNQNHIPVHKNVRGSEYYQ